MCIVPQILIIVCWFYYVCNRPTQQKNKMSDVCNQLDLIAVKQEPCECDDSFDFQVDPKASLAVTASLTTDVQSVISDGVSVSNLTQARTDNAQKEGINDDSGGSIQRKKSDIRCYRCIDCGMSFTRASKLKSHVLVHSLNKKQSEKADVMRKPYACWKCHARFEAPRLLHRHMMKHTGYFCQKCNREFQKHYSWKLHVSKCKGKQPKIKTYTCKACDIELEGLMRFKSHMRSHLGPKPHRCPHCPSAYSTPGKLKLHLLTHSGLRPFVCLRCSAAFARPDSLQTHERKCCNLWQPERGDSVTKEGQNGDDGRLLFKYYPCRTCSFVFPSKELLTRHHLLRKQFHFKCSKCCVEFCHYAALKEHQAACAAKQGTFVCSLCSSSFLRYELMTQHLKSCAGNAGRKVVFKCGQCGASFPQSSLLMVHMQTLHAKQQLHKCQQCTATFEWRASLQVHVRMVHPQKQFIRRSSAPVVTHVKCITCHLCGARFHCGQTYQNHFSERHPGEKAQELPRDLSSYSPRIFSQSYRPVMGAFSASVQATRVPANPTPHKCVVCDKQFLFRDVLNKHMATVHKDHKPYKCTECSKAFGRSDHLRRHAASHSEKPTHHSCTQCQKKFKQASSLTTHMQKYCRKRQYKCDYCTASFLNGSSLKAHARKHGHQTRFICEVCGLSVMHRSSLKVHLQRHADIRPYCCKECPARFTYPSSLKVHERKHSGRKPYDCPQCHKTFTHISTLKVHSRKYCKVKTVNTGDGSTESKDETSTDNKEESSTKNKKESSTQNKKESSTKNKKGSSTKNKKETSKENTENENNSITENENTKCENEGIANSESEENAHIENEQNAITEDEENVSTDKKEITSRYIY